MSERHSLCHIDLEAIEGLLAVLLPPHGFAFDGKRRPRCDAAPMHPFMFLGGFSEYCVVSTQSVVRGPETMPFDRWR